MAQRLGPLKPAVRALPDDNQNIGCHGILLFLWPGIDQNVRVTKTLEQASKCSGVGTLDKMVLPQTAEAEAGASQIDPGALFRQCRETFSGMGGTGCFLVPEKCICAVAGPHHRDLVAFFQSSLRDAQDRIHVLAAVGCRPQHESDLFHKSSVGIDSLKKSAFTCWMRSGFAAGPGLSAQIKQLISVEQTYKRFFIYIFCFVKPSFLPGFRMTVGS
jgi:hypothetical protein